VPDEFANQISLAEHQKAADYTIAKLRLGILENGVSAIILIGFTLLGGLQILNLSLLKMYWKLYMRRRWLDLFLESLLS
jgi:STE24 endopeptidase